MYRMSIETGILDAFSISFNHRFSADSLLCLCSMMLAIKWPGRYSFLTVYRIKMQHGGSRQDIKTVKQGHPTKMDKCDDF